VRIALALGWIGALPTVVGVLGAFAFPPDFSEHGRRYLNLSWVAFMVRTFAFHAAGGLAVAAMVAAVLRAPRLCLLAVAGTGMTVLFAGGSPAGAAAYFRPPASSVGVGGLSASGGANAREQGAGGGPRTLRVLTCNLWAGLRDVTRVLAVIEEHDPDVICFQEYTPEHDRMLGAALAGEYVFIEADPQRDFSGMATYSRVPMRRVPGRLLGPRGIGPVDPVDWERQLCCVVESGSAGDGLPGDEGAAGAREIVIQNIHLPTAPMGRSLLEQHRRMVEQIQSWLEDETRAVVLAGDFTTALR